MDLNQDCVAINHFWPFFCTLTCSGRKKSKILQTSDPIPPKLSIMTTSDAVNGSKTVQWARRGKKFLPYGSYFGAVNSQTTHATIVREKSHESAAGNYPGVSWNASRKSTGHNVLPLLTFDDIKFVPPYAIIEHSQSKRKKILHPMRRRKFSVKVSKFYEGKSWRCW